MDTDDYECKITNTTIDITADSDCTKLVGNKADCSLLSCSGNKISSTAASKCETTVTYNLLTNTNSNKLETSTPIETTISTLGLTSPATISYNGGTKSFATTDTIQSITNWLDTAGFTTSLTDGKLTITGADNLYITSFDSTLASALNLTGSWTTTRTETGNVTTTTSSTHTETIYTTNTLPSTQTIVTLNLTNSTRFSELGLSNQAYITLKVGGTQHVITVAQAMSAADLISRLNANSINASITDGKIFITPAANAYITGMSTNLRNLLHLNTNYYTTSTNYSNTNSKKLNTSSTHQIDYTTNLTQAGISKGNINIKHGGKDKTVNISSANTFNDLKNILHSNGLEMDITGGVVTITGAGDSYIKSGSLVNSLKLFSPTYSYKLIKLNTLSAPVVYSTTKENPAGSAPELIGLQIGISWDENSYLTFSTQVSLDNLNSLRRIGMDEDTDYLSRIDNLITTVQDKQVEMGAVINRLENALDQIYITYDNLVSMQSTIKDADIAEVSADYLRYQILQNASATLLATANQAPSVALGLI